MRTRARVDANHQQVVAALRAVGATVQSLASLGKGVPDLLVGFRGENWILEVKDGSKKPSARRLTPDESEWQGKWRGQCTTIESPDEALEIIGAKRAG